MGESVRVEFDIDPGNEGDASLERKSAMMDELYDKAKRLGLAIDDAGLDKIFVQGEETIRRYIGGLDRMLAKLREVRSAQQRLPLDEGGGFSPIGSQPSRLSPDESYRSPIRNIRNQLDLSSEQLQATRLDKEMDRVTQRFGPFAQEGEKVGKGLKSMAFGASELRERILSLSGIPAPEAVNQIFRLVGLAPEAGLALGAIAGAAIFLTKKVTDDLRQRAEEHLKNMEKAFSVKSTGISGGATQLRSELEDLERAKREIVQLRKVGDSTSANAIIKDKLGEGANDIVLDQRLKTAEYRFRELQRAAEAVGDDNLFKQAREEFRGLVNDGNSITFINRHLDELKNKYLAGGLSLEDYNKELKKFREELNASGKSSEEAGKSHDDFLKRQQEGRDLIRQTNEGLRSAFREVRVGDNPYATIFEQAEDRARKFITTYGRIGPDVVEPYITRLRDAMNLDVFKQDLASQGRLQELLRSKDQLELSPDAFQRARESRLLDFFNQQSDISSQIRGLRGQGDDPVQDAQRRVREAAELSGVSYAKAVEQATRGLNRDQLSQAGLDYRRANALQDIQSDQEREFRRQEIANRRNQERAEQAVRDVVALTGRSDFKTEEGRRAAEAAALDRLLQLTNVDPSQLSPELRDARQRSLDRRYELEARLREDAIKQQAALQLTLETLSKAVTKYAATTPTFILKVQTEDGTEKIELSKVLGDNSKDR